VSATATVAVPAPAAGHDVDVFRIRRSTAGGRPANTVAISDRSCVMVAIENGEACTEGLITPIVTFPCHRAQKN
jgi:hypothetical protein